MGKRKNYKNMNFNSKEDYLYAAHILIIRTYKSLKRYKRYRDSLEVYLNELVQKNIQYIDFEEYEAWEDKQKYVSHNLLICFVDDTSTGFSYIMFRRLVSRSQYAKLLEPMEEALEKQLAELRNVRNWTFHFAQSDFVAIKEMTYGGLTEELKGMIEFVPNPIVVSFPQKVSSEYIESLYLHMCHRISVFDKLFSSMKRDYEKLLGREVAILEGVESPMEYDRQHLGFAQLSMAIQEKRYDGTKESFDKVTLKELFE